MIRFNCDYSEGAHPKILERLQETNLQQTPGYGQDDYCLQAAALIKDQCQSPAADIHFLVGGTQTNLTIIATALRPYQGVISADSGHVNVHETGAIESTGHKVIALPAENAKLTAGKIRACCEAHFNDPTPEHAVQPKMVYISHPTEFGTLYSKKELQQISQICKQYNLYLFLDGARLGYGLAAQENDLDLPTIAQYCDIFYIGGTKIGALFGEAVVIGNSELKKDFRYMIKNRGALLAKGRLLGIQFLTLFENELYWKISAHANKMSEQIKQILCAAGTQFLFDSPTNQLFPILPDQALKELEKKYVFTPIRRIDDNRQAVRICTSWATREDDVQQLCQDLRRTL